MRKATNTDLTNSALLRRSLSGTARPKGNNYFNLSHILMGLFVLMGMLISGSVFASRQISISGGGNAAGNICVPTGTPGALVYSFAANSTGTQSCTINSLNFSASGYVAGDVASYDLYTNHGSNSFAGASYVTTRTATGSPGSFNFSSVNESVPNGSTYYYFIVVNAASGCTIGNNVTIGSISNFNVNTNGSVSGGPIPAGGAQTFVASPSISGVSTICVGTSTTLTGIPSGGTWSSGSTGIATVISGSGLVGAVAAGTATISYTKSGCTGTYAETTTTVSAPSFSVTPSAAAICGAAQLLSAPPVSGGATTVTYSGTAFTVPDNSSAGITNSVSVSGIPTDATITGVDVLLTSVTMSRDRDLTFNVQAPNLNILNIIDREGSFSGSNFVNTIISSGSTNGFTSAPFTGTFEADESMSVGPSSYQSNVSDWSYLFSQPNGTWLLAVRDQSFGNVATVNTWSLVIHYTTPPATYTWSPTAGLYTNSTLTTTYTGGTANSVYANPGSATTYTATKSETGFCNVTNTSVLTIGSTPSLTGLPSNQNLCYNASSSQTASFAYTATTGSASQYTLTWSPAGPVDVSSFTALPGSPAGSLSVTVPAGTGIGAYTGTLTVKNAAGCSSTSTITINIGGTPSLTGLTTNQSVCFNGSSVQTASYSYTGVSNGANQYTLAWLPGGVITNVATYTGIPAGSIGVSIPAGATSGVYNGILTLQNAAGCTSNAALTLTINGTPSVAGLPASQSACYNASSSQTANFLYTGVNNGADQYSVSWSPGGVLTDVSSPTSLPGTPAGLFSINIPAGGAPNSYTGSMVVKNSVTGCVSNQTISVNVNSLPAVSGLTASATVCYDPSTSGMASFPFTGLSGGTDKYTLTWSPGGVLADVSSFTSISGSAFNVIVPAGATAGIYNGTLTVKNSASGCTTQYPLTLTINGMPTLTSLATIQQLCYDAASSQTASFSYSGTTNSPTDFTLAWTPGGVLTDVSSFTALPGSTFNVSVPAGTATGSYAGVLTVKNAVTGCTGTSNITIVVNGHPSLSGLTTDVQKCFNASASQTASFDYISPVNGADAYTLTWAPGGALTDVSAFSPITAGSINVTIPAGAAANTYTGTLTTKNSTTGCTESTTVTLSINALPQITGLTTSQVLCYNASVDQSASFAYTGVNNGADQFTLTWSPSGMLADVNAATSLPGSSIDVDIPAGTAVNTYNGTLTVMNSTNGCSSTTTVDAVVNPLPNAGSISGVYVVCPSAVTTLSNSATGGAWSSDATSMATVNSAGDVTGVSAGIATISYTVNNSCGTAAATASVTVNPLPITLPITGISSVCTGTTVPASEATTGGAWISSDLSVATVNASGVVAGVSGGIATISYAIVNSCGSGFSTAPITVNVTPEAITGTLGVCEGSTSALSDPTTGGTWSSSNGSLATVDMTSGIVTGVVAAGSPTITYTSAEGCTITTQVTVNPLPAAITGPLTFCAGLNTTLTDITTGGNWTSSDPGVAITAAGGPGIGIITGVSFGSAVITYTLPTGCIANTVVAVEAAPSIIGGTTSVCFGTPMTLSNFYSGGTWVSSDPGVAVIDPVTGDATGISVGTAVITYTLPSGCLTTTPVVIKDVPSAITGTTDVCVGASTTLSNSVNGGTWSSSDISLATIISTTSGSATISGISAGTPSISYLLSNGCSVSAMINVNPLPTSPAPITGTTTLCESSAAILGDLTTGGDWSSSNPSVASVGPTGVILGLSSGVSTISYTMTNGCGSTSVTSMLTINPLPVTPAAITGIMTACAGHTTLLSDATFGGSWISADPSIATITTSGVVTGIVEGTATISYTKSNLCGTTLVTTTVTINPLPVSGAVSGTSALCAGTTATLSDPAAGGVWSSSNTAVATVTGAGLVSAFGAGVANISYTVTNGCGTVAATQMMTVNPLPATPGSISGVNEVCPLVSSLLSNTLPGGAWSSADPSIATVNTTGMVTAVSTGSTTISYTNSNGCGSAYVVKSFTVDPLPVAGAITGTPVVCAGSVRILSDLPSGGTWTSDNNSVAIITATGVVTGITPGTATISYVAENSCGYSSAATVVVTVNPIPDAGTIMGQSKVCIGDTIMLSNAAAGGVWSSTNPSIATISGAGVVTGVFPGADSIVYTVTNACGTVTAVAAIGVRQPGECDTHAGMAASATPAALAAYPNPNNGVFNVMLSSANDEDMHVTITNVLGQKVQELSGRTNRETEIHLAHATGNYIVTVVTASGRYVAKVTVD